MPKNRRMQSSLCYDGPPEMFRMQTFLMRENVPDKILISRMEMDFKKRSVKSAESEVANDD